MPFVEVKVAGKLSLEQKKNISSKIAGVLEEEANKPRSATYVVIEEVDRENWAVGDTLLSEKPAK